MIDKYLEILKEINSSFEALSLNFRIEKISSLLSDAVFTTSFGKEDQIILHTIAENRSKIRVATLQTGRLFPETIELIAESRRRYSVEIEAFHPNEEAVANYSEKFGPNGFYDSVEARHACCKIRKLEPLRQALRSADGWVTGLRRGQSENRRETPFAEWSSEYEVLKINPLADWSGEAMEEAIRRNDIPVNALHARGYASIGCEPCTRAIKPGEPERNGRWWWEREDSRECGLHVEKPLNTRGDVSGEGVASRD